MAKTKITKELELEIFSAIQNLDNFCCLEVTIGWYGKERVDMLSYNTNGIFKCFEIKTSLADFHSSAKKTFLGHYNYFVITPKLYEKIKDEVPEHVGIYVGGTCYKKAKYQEISQETKDLLKNSMIRSLSRDATKFLMQDSENELEKRNREINELRREVKNYRSQYQEMKRIYEKNGRRYNIEHYPEFFQDEE